jgi:hypothetical protein
MLLRTNKRLSGDEGAVTAELAVVLPAVLMILATSLSSVSAQVERMRLISVAAGLARAVARGEQPEQVSRVFRDQLVGRKVTFSTSGQFACVEVVAQVELLGLAGLPLRLADRECQRRVGL